MVGEIFLIYIDVKSWFHFPRHLPNIIKIGQCLSKLRLMKDGNGFFRHSVHVLLSTMTTLTTLSAVCTAKLGWAL